jgi:hypothetical protein
MDVSEVILARDLRIADPPSSLEDNERTINSLDSTVLLGLPCAAIVL